MSLLSCLTSKGQTALVAALLCPHEILDLELRHHRWYQRLPVRLDGYRFRAPIHSSGGPIMEIFANANNCLWILAISVTIIALAKALKRFRDKAAAKKSGG